MSWWSTFSRVNRLRHSSLIFRVLRDPMISQGYCIRMSVHIPIYKPTSMFKYLPTLVGMVIVIKLLFRFQTCFKYFFDSDSIVICFDFVPVSTLFCLCFYDLLFLFR